MKELLLRMAIVLPLSAILGAAIPAAMCLAAHFLERTGIGSQIACHGVVFAFMLVSAAIRGCAVFGLILTLLGNGPLRDSSRSRWMATGSGVGALVGAGVGLYGAPPAASPTGFLDFATGALAQAAVGALGGLLVGVALGFVGWLGGLGSPRGAA